MRRPALGAVLAALALLAGCARRAEREQALPPRRPAFVPYPPDRVAGVKDPHSFEGKPLCQACHLPDTGALVAEPVALCERCHSFPHRNHPVDVVQRDGAEGLPLRSGRRLACHTCHDPHEVRRTKDGLRLPYDQLCLRCHRRHHHGAPAPGR